MSELRFEWKNMLAADLGEESCVPDLLGERILQNSLKFYLDETDEIYEGYGKVADSYPCIQGWCLIKNVYMHKSVDMMRKGTVER